LALISSFALIYIAGAVLAQAPAILAPTPTEVPAPVPENANTPTLEPADAANDNSSSRNVPTPAPPALEIAPNGAKSSGKAAVAQSEDLASALERRGDLNLHGLTLNSALFTISEQWNVNIVAGNVEGTVNGVFKQAPLREILDSILLSNGYNYRAVGKSLVVSSVAELGQINPFFQSATIPVRTADIDEVVEVAKLLNTPQGQVRPLKSARCIVVLDFPDRVEMIRQFVAANDGASGRLAGTGGGNGLLLDVAHFRTQHISAKAAETALQAVLSKDGRVGVLEREDRLVVTDYAENLDMVEKVLLRIDQPRPQVRITALIYDISLQDMEQLGLNLTKVGFNVGGSSVDAAVGTSPFNSLTLADGAMTALEGAGKGNIAIGTLGTDFDINAVLLCLKQAKDARLLADPNVAVLDNELAVFQSVQEIPIQQLTETAQGGNIGTTAFKEAGITLTVTPKIAADCTISMEVSPVFSRHVGNDEAGQPIIDRREARTRLRVANGQTIVIGGLRQREDLGQFNGIPYLMDLKYVGRLFRSRSTTVRESELVVFISPEIIHCDEEPTDRQLMAEDTVRCRLNHIPEAEGCPPSCRRLPPETVIEGEISEPGSADEDQPLPMEDNSAASEKLPTIQQPDDLPPLSASHIPSAECQFGVAGRSEHVRALVADGRLRRLPTVESTTTPDQRDPIQVADGQPGGPVRR
jgi:general secretion pathway protein D